MPQIIEKTVAWVFVLLFLWRLERISERIRVIMVILQDWDKKKVP
jgi:hypothetical protein